MVDIVPPDALVDALQTGERLYVPGSTGEPMAFLRALTARPDATREVRITTSAVPGINAVPVDALHASASVTGLFMQPGLRAAQREGRFCHLPVSFAGFVEILRDRTAFDTCVVHVAPPDGEGQCSLGPAVEFTPLAMARSRRAFAVINPGIPTIPGAVSVPLAAFDLVTESDDPLPVYDVGAPSSAAAAIAAHTAAFVQDGSALQAGLGKVPEQLFGMLHDRRGLRLQSGMLGDGALALSDAGALDSDFRHMSCVWVGSRDLYASLAGRPGFAVLSCDVTHDIRILSESDRFVAVNSALSVDLFGQANLEHAEGRAVSGLGGAADFAAAARLSRGGVSIVALPAAFGRESRSRIVPRIADAVVSLPRHAVDMVVTEHGAADLRGLCVHGRAEALIAIAAPEFRSDLAAAWAEIKQTL